MGRRHIRLAGYLIGAIFFLEIFLSCGLLVKKRQLEPTPEYLYDSAMILFEKKKYSQAEEAFRKFKEEYPLNEYAPLVDLRIADTNFFNKKYGEAILLYEEFKKLHPLHPEIPYVIYQLGNCHYKQMYTLDRDQTETERAIEQYRYLIENFPQSPYADEGRKMMQVCQKQLADREFYVAKFYIRTKKYKAALGRLEVISQKYPGFGLDNDVKRLAKVCQIEIAKEEKKEKAKAEKTVKKKAEETGLGSMAPPPASP